MRERLLSGACVLAVLLILGWLWAPVLKGSLATWEFEDAVVVGPQPLIESGNTFRVIDCRSAQDDLFAALCRLIQRRARQNKGDVATFRGIFPPQDADRQRLRALEICVEPQIPVPPVEDHGAARAGDGLLRQTP